MPPASRGPRILKFVRRYATVNDNVQASTKGFLPKTMPYKKPRLPDHGPSKPAPAPKAQSESAPMNPLEAPGTNSPSGLERFRNYIPYPYRRAIASILIFGPIITIVWMHFPIEVMWTTGSSMSPYFNPNSSPDAPESKDKLLVQRLSFPSRSSIGLSTPKLEFRRGQIVVFHTPHDPNKIAVKRIIGLPGDRVQPLPGYPGGNDPVVVQYNHIWVEGDVDDRNKSIDSNWYGPISQNMIIGQVHSILEPWYSPTLVDLDDHTYPAKEKRRVEENAVSYEALDPDTKAKDESFKNGRAAMDLEFLQDNRVSMPQTLRLESKRKIAVEMYLAAKSEMAKEHPMTLELATELTKELEMAFLRSGLTHDGQVKNLPPGMQAEQDTLDEGKAKRALREYLEKQRQEKEEQGMDLDDRQHGWLIQAKDMQAAQDRQKREAAEKKRLEAAEKVRAVQRD